MNDNKLWDSLYNHFRDERCENCFNAINSNARIAQPEPIPYIGPNFKKDKHRLMFVGIETYCNKPRDKFSDTEYGVFDQKQIEDLFFKRKESGITNSPFWNWVNSIATEVLSPGNPEDAFSRIAYSNLNKCQSRRKDASEADFCDSSYKLSETLSRNCIQWQRWIFKEIDKIDARNIIVFAGRKKGGLLARIFLNYNGNEALSKFEYSDGSRKDLDLFIHLRKGGRRFIITNHPQGTPDELRREIVRILKEND
jgi:hypothetical protein